MRSPRVRSDASAWAPGLVAVVLAVTPAPSCATRRSGDPVEHRPVAVAELVESLWQSQEGARRAITAEDFAEVHAYEADLDVALHDLEASADALPEPRRQSAHELLGSLFEVVDGLHEGAELRDARTLGALLIRLGILVGQLEPILVGPASDDSPASTRAPEHRGRDNTRKVSP